MMTNAEFSQYLVFLLVNAQVEQFKSPQEWAAHRQMAGLMLKNACVQHKHFVSMTSESQQWFKGMLLSPRSIGDESRDVRIATSQCITAVVTLGRLQNWPQLIPTLLQMLGSGNDHWIDGAFSALLMVCEDSAPQMNRDDAKNPTQYFSDLVPTLLSFFQHPNATFRMCAVKCIHQFLVLLPYALLVHMEEYMAGLAMLSADSDSKVRRCVCQAIVVLTEVKLDVILPQFNSVSVFMLKASADTDDPTALDACEFWQAIAEILDEQGHSISEEEVRGLDQQFRALLPNLLPLLLRRMVYSQEEIDTLELAAEEDQSAPDRPQDVAPRTHKGARSGDDDDDEDFKEEDFVWNIRKCCANALDTISKVYRDDILVVVLPLLNEVGWLGGWVGWSLLSSFPTNQQTNNPTLPCLSSPVVPSLHSFSLSLSLSLGSTSQ